MQDPPPPLSSAPSAVLTAAFFFPQVRLVSQELLFTPNDNISLDSTLSHLLVEWGQWIDHDIAQTPQSPSTAAFSSGADCSHTCSQEAPCFPIQVRSLRSKSEGKNTSFMRLVHQFVLQIPLSDPRNGTQSCMPFFRSAPSCVAGILSRRHREQLNAITSFVDASMVYGSSSSWALALRNLSSPLGSLALNSQHSDQGLAYMPSLPRVQSHLDPCGPRNATVSGGGSEHVGNNTSCFQAGE